MAAGEWLMVNEERKSSGTDYIVRICHLRFFDLLATFSIGRQPFRRSILYVLLKNAYIIRLGWPVKKPFSGGAVK